LFELAVDGSVRGEILLPQACAAKRAGDPWRAQGYSTTRAK
jgi:hypothetical protein